MAYILLILLKTQMQKRLRVFNMNKPGALLNVVLGGAEGTLIEETKNDQ